ncbi:uncharacterized protein TM35_000252310 [Trypanosoma theileri]|uniref:Uncharacterized protein n=1 Tax=Trypanosoma theileri TaxID=67003 RepID=A0A1X0NQE7_9TRYP|nr:uncharacterized protein TM35_000252310 [Trypanosoma theileri]ORC86935.1 hypothetical protein TM35_000252310 [Trypanosoma theileri]
MILGIGDGTFAILFVTVFGIVMTLVGSYMLPRLAIVIGAVSLSLPFIVYGCIISAPHGPVPPPMPPTSYNREQPLRMDIALVDYFLPVRIVAMLVLILALAAGVGYYVLLVVREPPYKAPRVYSLREQLEELHPTWYR